VWVLTGLDTEQDRSLGDFLASGELKKAPLFSQNLKEICKRLPGPKIWLRDLFYRWGKVSGSDRWVTDQDGGKTEKGQRYPRRGGTGR